MSGELQVVFIYDTLRCRKEEDDPSEAILYFHPEEIPENRRIAICGQLMGITHFLLDFFSAPKILTLENGKFALRDFGKQYVLALGCSSVTPDWLLEKQADILYNLTRFFHKDIDNILKSVNGDRNLLSCKLSSIMDHYLPISQHHGDLFALTFGILPILNLPKSANHISLSAAVILQTCMLRKGVLGGIIMFQNKVVGVELVQEIAQKLTFIQPYQLPPADAVKPSYDLPPSVQLLTVYIQQKDLSKLKKHSSTYQYPSQYETNLSNRKENINSRGKIDAIREEEPSDDVSSSLGFSEPSESNQSESNHLPEELQGLDNSLTYSSLGTSDDKENIDSSLSKFKSEKDTKLSQSNVWSKYLKEEERVSGTEDDPSRKFSLSFPPPCVHKNGCGSNFLHPPRLFQSLDNLTQIRTTEKNTKSFSASLNDPFFPYIRCDGKSLSKALLNTYTYPDYDPNQEEFKDDVEIEEEKQRKLCDPNEKYLHEVNDSGVKGLEYANKNKIVDNIKLSGCIEAIEVDFSLDKANIVEDDYQKKDSKRSVEGFKLGMKPSTGLTRPKDLALNTSSSKTKSRRRWSTFEDMMSPLIENPPPLIEVEGNTPREKSASFCSGDKDFMFKNTLNEVEDIGLGDPLIRTRMLNSFRKISSPEESYSNHNTSNESDLELSNTKSKGSNIQVDNKDIEVPSTEKEHKNKTLNKNEKKEKEENNPESYEKSLLFIYSLGGMRLLLLLEKEYLSDSELIHSLWDYGSSSISELEVSVSNVEEQSMSMGHGHHDHYCYLHYEPVWRSLAHGGRNHSMDFDVVQHMHQDFQVYPTINELIIRGEDHVVYGYQCVGSEVFYQQSAGPQPGLPMPSDLMGKVPLKAKRRLERDHNILLL